MISKRVTARDSYKFIGTKVVLWKLICRPVAFAKIWRVCFRCCAAVGDAFAIIRCHLHNEAQLGDVFSDGV
jgi:hypothetical protein